MLAPNPTVVVSWPIAGDAPDLLAIVQNQAEVIQDQEALLHAYQLNLNAAQQLPSGTPATATGSTTGTSSSVALTGTSATIVTGSVITGTGVPTVPAAPTVLGQISGTTGRDGTYLASVALVLPTATALTFTPPPPPEFSAWPAATDAPTLDLLVQTQTAVIRVQTALLQHYQDLLNQSGTPAPPTGP